MRRGRPEAREAVIASLAASRQGRGFLSDQKAGACLPARQLWAPPSVLETPSRGPHLNPSATQGPSAFQSVGAAMICPWLSTSYSRPFTECTGGTLGSLF